MYLNSSDTLCTASLVSVHEIFPGPVCVSLFYYMDHNSTTITISKKGSSTGQTATIKEIVGSNEISWSEAIFNTTSTTAWRVWFFFGFVSCPIIIILWCMLITMRCIIYILICIFYNCMMYTVKLSNSLVPIFVDGGYFVYLLGCNFVKYTSQEIEHTSQDFQIYITRY